VQYQNKLITFNPSITTKNNLTKCFQIFTNPKVPSKQPAKRRIDPGANLRHQTVSVYTDGACLNNGKSNTQSGSGIWFGPDDYRNKAIKIPGVEQSNQIGELVAVIGAMQNLPTFYPLKINTDSKYVINGLTTHLPHWEDIGWIGIQNASLFQRAAFLLRHKSATTHLKWVKGHNGDLGNEESNRLAKEGVNKPVPDVPRVTSPC
jgi:ribonuclease HI